MVVIDHEGCMEKSWMMFPDIQYGDLKLVRRTLCCFSIVFERCQRFTRVTYFYTGDILE